MCASRGPAHSPRWDMLSPTSCHGAQHPSQHSLLLPGPSRFGHSEWRTLIYPPSSIQGQPRSVKAQEVAAGLCSAKSNRMCCLGIPGGPLPSHGKVRSSPILNSKQEIHDVFDRTSRAAWGVIPSHPWAQSHRRDEQEHVLTAQPSEEERHPLAQGRWVLHKVQTHPFQKHQ